MIGTLASSRENTPIRVFGGTRVAFKDVNDARDLGNELGLQRNTPFREFTATRPIPHEFTAVNSWWGQIWAKMTSNT